MLHRTPSESTESDRKVQKVRVPLVKSAIILKLKQSRSSTLVD